MPASPSLAPRFPASDGLVLIFDTLDSAGLALVLAFYPVIPDRPEPPGSLFAAAEADEFQRHALAQSADTIAVWRDRPIARCRPPH